MARCVKATGEAGIEYLHPHGRFHDVSPVDPVVCDLNMPCVSGFEFFAKVKQQSGDSTRLTTKAAYSASSSATDVRRAYEHWASSYVFEVMTCSD